MQPGRSKDLVAAAALAGALGLGGFLFLRARGVLGSSWTDGARTFPAETGAAVRHAVWDEPEDMERLGEATDPTLSGDGRWLVFACGARGLNSELFLAEMEDGVPRAPRPLEALNSPADECAPAFGHGALYFASDRAGGAGGLDLWRAPFDAGEFGAVERLGPGLNSAADETDPAPLAGTRTLVFASDRARADLDLYRATPDAGGFFACESLAALNTPAEEREPAFSDDPRSLTFASDRPGGAGALDLYRALCFEGAGATDGWGEPVRISELCTPRSECAPWLAGNGFELWFAEQGEDGVSTLRRARSRELFRVPAPAVTLAQWLTLAALLLLALLALLAKRWHALDILYKCLLASLLLHLLLMLYLQTVVPEEQDYSTGTEEGPSFRVRMAPPEPSGAAQGLTGPSAPERTRFEEETPRAGSPPLLALALPERAEEAAPRRENALTPAASARPSPSLAQPAEPSERYENRAPELALALRTSTPRDSQASGPEGLVRAQPSATALGTAVAGAAEIPAAEAALDELARGVAPAAALERGPSAHRAPALAAPAERFERASGAAPALALQTPLAAVREKSRAGAPAQARLATERGAADPGAVAPARPTAGLPSAPHASTAEAQAAPAPERLAHADARDEPAPDPEPELRAPRAELAGKPLRASASFDAVAGLDLASAPARAAPDAPERARTSAPATASARPEPHLLAPAALTRAAPEPVPDRAPPPRLAETPYQNRFGEQKLRALEDFGGSSETEHAVAAGLDYLARIQGENGAWGQRADAHPKYLDVRVGKSALALLAYLGAGHVPNGTSAHAQVADRAVRYLLSVQDERTGHFGRSCSYGHGIATYALAECYALTQEERLRAPLEHAVEEILRHQSARDDPRFSGGWGYYFADGHVWNGDEWPRTSVTAWQVMALESAVLGGLVVPERAFAAAREFLVNTWDERARAFRYDHDPERLSSGYPILPASTPAALFALALLDVDPRAAELAPARRFVLTRAPDGYRYTGDDDFVEHARGNLYFWYYSTLALFVVGGAEWERWNAALQATLLPAQDADGSWRPLDTYSAYAGDDDDERTYSTAMCVLSLEIYYRYFTPLLKVR